MNERLQVVVTTVIIFLLGLGVGVWTQRMRPMPPPPIGVMGEFGPVTTGGFGPVSLPPPIMIGFGHGPPIGPGEMRVRIQALQPRIDAFRHSVETIEAGFRTQLDTLLTGAQRGTLHALETSMPPPPPLPGCAGEMGNLFVPMVIYRPTLDHLTEVLGLNPSQHDRLRKLMIDRRDHLLALIDETPPPSFQLGRMLVRGAAVTFPPTP